MQNKNDDELPIWVIGFFLLLILIIYVGTLGKIGPNNVVKFPDEYKDSTEEARRRHKRLKELLDKQQGLKAKLDKKFKWTYFFVRLFSVLSWFALMIVFVFLGLIHNLGDALNYSEGCILLLITINFVTFGSLTNLDKFSDSIKTKTENWVYGKYLSLDEKINLNKAEKTKLSMVLEKSDPAVSDIYEHKNILNGGLNKT